MGIPIEDVETLRTALAAASVPNEIVRYEGAEHGFLAYTRHPEYKPDAAQEAWKRTVTFLNKYLKK